MNDDRALPSRKGTGPSAAPTAPDDGIAAPLRGVRPPGLLAILLILLTGNLEVAPMVFLPVGAILVLVWVRLSRTPWREIGYARPRSWLGTIVVGIVFGAAFKIAMKM